MNDLRSHFAFHSTPFTREIAVEHRLTLPLFDEPLAALKGVVDQRMSGALIAPPGTGKTQLLRALRAGLPEARYRVHYVKVTGLSKRDMCREITTAIGAVGVSSLSTFAVGFDVRIPNQWIGPDGGTYEDPANWTDNIVPGGRCPVSIIR